MALGAGIGGVAGLASSEGDAGASFESAMKGAALGGIAGLGASAVVASPRMAMGAKRAVQARGKKILSKNLSGKLSSATAIRPLTKAAYTKEQAILKQMNSSSQQMMRGLPFSKTIRNRGKGKLLSDVKKIRSEFPKASHEDLLGRKTVAGTKYKRAVANANDSSKQFRAGFRADSRLPKKVAGVAGKLAVGAANNPLLTTAVVGGSIGMGVASHSFGASAGTHQSLSSPFLEGAQMDASYDQQMMMSEQMGQIGGGELGSAEVMQGQFQESEWMQDAAASVVSGSKTGRFVNSTVGLPQAMHNGRHS